MLDKQKIILYIQTMLLICLLGLGLFIILRPEFLPSIATYVDAGKAGQAFVFNAYYACPKARQEIM